MGCNYYLHKKAKYTPKNQRERNWHEKYDFNFFENEYNHVIELTNGYVFNNTFYKNLDELNQVYYLTYHIGKSSVGWRFLLQVYPEQGINNLKDWKKLFGKNDIYSECNEQLTKKDMINIITKRKPLDNFKNKTSYISSDGETYEIRNGLIVHPLKYHIIDNSAKETYDVCEGDFS